MKTVNPLESETAQLFEALRGAVRHLGDQDVGGFRVRAPSMPGHQGDQRDRR
jgi:hypothetical protein